MTFNHVVRIPRVPGKIVKRKVNDSVYVEYEIWRDYDPNRKYNTPKRVRIGVQIPGQPELMLPNEQYQTYFPKEGTKMDAEEKNRMDACETKRESCFMLRDFFEQLFFEFQMMARKNAEGIVNENKVRRLNKVLSPLMDMMKDQAYAQFLELIPEPETRETKDGGTITTGMNYGDVALLMTQFKGAVNRFFQKSCDLCICPCLSADQNEERQMIAMREKHVPEENIFIDKQSGNQPFIKRVRKVCLC